MDANPVRGNRKCTQVNATGNGEWNREYTRIRVPEFTTKTQAEICEICVAKMQDHRFREDLLRIQPQIPQIPLGVLGVLGGEFSGFVADRCLSVFVGVSRWFTLRFWSLVAAIGPRCALPALACSLVI